MGFTAPDRPVPVSASVETLILCGAAFVGSIIHIPSDTNNQRGRHTQTLKGEALKTMQDLTYWQKNLRLIFRCLVIWFVVSYGFGLLLVEPLNEIRLGGYKLGFWFAQQGSIYVFCALVFYYAWAMNKLDAEFGVKE